MQLDIDPEFTFDTTGCRMHLSLHLGHGHNARNLLESLQAVLTDAYEAAVEEERRERESERLYRESVRATYDESRSA